MVWLGGGTVGVADVTLMRDPSMVALNVITAGMDLTGIGLALAFTHQWGLRIPAWLLLPPMWVATGLLARFIIAVPIAIVVGWLMPAAVPRIIGGPVEPWVYAVVYTEFAGMGVGLIVAFFFYARVRWAALLEVQAAVPQKTTRELQVMLANTATVIASLSGVLFIAWALGATFGLDAAAAARRTIVGSLINGIDGVLMIGGAVGIQLMVRGLRAGSPVLGSGIAHLDWRRLDVRLGALANGHRPRTDGPGTRARNGAGEPFRAGSFDRRVGTGPADALCAG